MKVIVCSIVPILSGITSWRTVVWAEDKRRVHDDIHKYSLLISDSLDNEKTSRKEAKKLMTHIDWNKLKEQKNKIKKGKKLTTNFFEKSYKKV